MSSIRTKINVSNWHQFDRCVRYRVPKLLCDLDKYPNPILVAGCQRSGTTILSRVITQSDGVGRYKCTKDDELDAALILSGNIQLEKDTRFCFQTTYLNANYREYYEHIGYKLIWVLRNPYAVVYSMLANWKRSALNRLFRHCGSSLLSDTAKKKHETYGAWIFSRIHKACLSYNAKIMQLTELRSSLSPDMFFVIDYDDLVINTDNILPKIYKFMDLDYKNDYRGVINSKSVKKVDKLSEKQEKYIRERCVPAYTEAKKLLTMQIRT